MSQTATFHIVEHDYAALGKEWLSPPTDDVSDIADDILNGHLEKVCRVVAVNLHEGWARDVSQDIVKIMRPYLPPHPVGDLAAFLSRNEPAS